MAEMSEALQKAYAEFRAALALADEQSEGTYYAAFYTAVAHLQARVNNIVEHFRPGIEVPGALRLPLSQERQDRILRESSEIPDHLPDEEEP